MNRNGINLEGDIFHPENLTTLRDLTALPDKSGRYQTVTGWTPRALESVLVGFPLLPKNGGFPEPYLHSAILGVAFSLT